MSSVLEELQDEMWRILQQMNKEILQLTAGEIYLISITTLEKICSQQKIFSKMINDQKKYKKAYKKGF